MKTRCFKNVGLVLLGGLILSRAIGAPEVRPQTENRLPLWKVEGARQPLYLLGSVHFLKATDYPLAPAIEAAFSNAQVVAFETDIGKLEDPALQLSMLSKSRLPEGETLKDQLTAATYDQFKAAASDAGVPLAMFDELKPALAAIMLVAIEVEKLGFEPELGLDKHFYDLAKKAAKEVVPLETVEHQLNLVTDFSKEEGELLMKSTLKELETTRKSFTDIFKAWRMGDEQAMEKLLNGASREAPAIFKRLVTDRNANWVPKIEEFARGARPAIVIVGAGHLVGKDSVVDLLRKKGMEVRQK